MIAGNWVIIQSVKLFANVVQNSWLKIFSILFSLVVFIPFDVESFNLKDYASFFKLEEIVS
jgi:hypothetical protein